MFKSLGREVGRPSSLHLRIHLENGNLSLTNAAQINTSLGQYEKEKQHQSTPRP